MRDDFVPVDVDGESGGIGVMGDVDDAATISGKVFQNGEVSLSRRLLFNKARAWKGRYTYLVMDLSPSLVFKVIMFESLKAIDPDIEIGSIKD